MKRHERHYHQQERRAEQLKTFARHRLSYLVSSNAWLILRMENGGVFGAVRWMARAAWTKVVVDVRLWWRLNIRRMDPDDEKTWQ